MSAASGVFFVVAALVLVALLAYVASYNRFGRQRNMIEESWRQVDVELQRRHDLIGNLVEVTAAAARFERATLVAITQARAQAVAAQGTGPDRQGRAEQALDGALASFFQVAEAHPDLRSNEDFRYLQTQLVECEDRIAAGRRFYNGNVRAYNTRFDTFPSSLVAGAGRFQKKDYYEVDDPRVRVAPSPRSALGDLGEQVSPTPPPGRPTPPPRIDGPPQQ